MENVGEERSHRQQDSQKVEQDGPAHTAIPVTPNTELQQNRGQPDRSHHHQRQRTEKGTWAGVKNHHCKGGAE